MSIFKMMLHALAGHTMPGNVVGGLVLLDVLALGSVYNPILTMHIYFLARHHQTLMAFF